MSALVAVVLAIVFLLVAVALVVSRFNLKIKLPQKQKSPETPTHDHKHEDKEDHPKKEHAKGKGDHHGPPFWLVSLAMFGVIALGLLLFAGIGGQRLANNVVKGVFMGVFNVFVDTPATPTTSTRSDVVGPPALLVHKTNCAADSTEERMITFNGETRWLSPPRGQGDFVLCFEGDSWKKLQSGEFEHWCKQGRVVFKGMPDCKYAHERIQFRSNKEVTVYYRWQPVH